ncbi:MAG: signal recognition particle-docking protein FtsY [Candidatus Dadabacteria bacterium]|nr:signal recognition particle-docking protein FtsY [Candidatus Dadabacteria bacterium]MDE0662415.1 signal recognition particle-docking protein FtsY [Candidatus Dadabacteria bacterium]MXZ48482.1 signal recognition particle-docking protein FtsY [Candidatus Dadabacteria bacterium]
MKEATELLSGLGTHIDLEIAIPVAIAVAVLAAVYFLFRKKEVAPETVAQQQPEAVSAEPEEVEPPPEPPAPEAAPGQVVETAPEPQFTAPEPVAVEEDIVTPPADSVPVAEPIEVSEEPISPEETEAEPEEPKAEEEPEETKVPEEPEEEVVAEEKEDDTEGDFFSRLSFGLSKTRRGILQNLEHVFSSGKIDDAAWDEFEEVLIMSDMGVATTAKLREKVSSAVGVGDGGDMEKIKSLLEKEILDILRGVESPVVELSAKPTVFMVAGVNGVGKTTSIGKIANRFTREEKKVMVAAADTFRAAAVEQLGVWAERVGSDFLRGQTGADPSAVAYDAVKASVSRGIDLLIIDTAGRVHTKTGLMDELKKLRRVVARELEGAPHETLLVVDATTGQNAVEQARVFGEAIGVTGIVLTKLDGTAKGGIIVAIAEQLGLPVKYIGVGEGLGDLREFDAEQFTRALFTSDKEALH